MLNTLSSFSLQGDIVDAGSWLKVEHVEASYVWFANCRGRDAISVWLVRCVLGRPAKGISESLRKRSIRALS